LFERFKKLPLKEQKANKPYLQSLLLKMIPLKDPKKQKEHLKDTVFVGGGMRPVRVKPKCAHNLRQQFIRQKL